MFSNISESWIIVLVSCLVGFVIGQWLKTRRNKVKRNDEYVNGLKRRVLAETLVQTKKAKKNRRANKKNGGA